MTGTREISGSEATMFRNDVMAVGASSMASSMLTSMIWAPPCTCWRATSSASSWRPSRISRANFLLPATFVRSPMFTNSEFSSRRSASSPAR